MVSGGRRDLAATTGELDACKRREAAALGAVERAHSEAAEKLASARQEAEVRTPTPCYHVTGPYLSCPSPKLPSNVSLESGEGPYSGAAAVVIHIAGPRS